MNQCTCDIATFEREFRAAFAGTTLGTGVSIRQSEVMSRFGEGCTDEEFEVLPADENAMDWTNLPPEELDRACVAFFDPEAFRFYIPALLLNLARRYDSLSFGTISTLGSLCPAPHRSYGNAEALIWAKLDERQRHAIAQFMHCLPTLVTLDKEDEERVQQSFSQYWQDYAAAAE